MESSFELSTRFVYSAVACPHLRVLKDVLIEVTVFCLVRSSVVSVFYIESKNAYTKWKETFGTGGVPLVEWRQHAKLWSYAALSVWSVWSIVVLRFKFGSVVF